MPDTGSDSLRVYSAMQPVIAPAILTLPASAISPAGTTPLGEQLAQMVAECNGLIPRIEGRIKKLGEGLLKTRIWNAPLGSCLIVAMTPKCEPAWYACQRPVAVVRCG